MNTLPVTTQASLLHVSGRSGHSIANHLTAPCRRFHTQPLSATGSFGLRLARAGSPHGPAESRSSPTDCPVISRSFPPPLARTQ